METTPPLHPRAPHVTEIPAGKRHCEKRENSASLLGKRGRRRHSRKYHSLGKSAGWELAPDWETTPLKKIVLTGGPCGGKTECLQAIAQRFGDLVVVVPESATLVLNRPCPASEEFPDWTSALRAEESWRKRFQEEVLRSQWELEQAKETEARALGRQWLVCDRGLLDGAAYWPGGLAPFLAHFLLELQFCQARYHGVIHLESSVMAGDGFFSRQGNPSRFEEDQEARLRESLVRQAWDHHPRRAVIAANRDFEQKKRAVLIEVARFLSGE